MEVSSITLPDGDMLLSVSVRDTGIGIAANKVGSIFDSFRQLDGGFAKRFGGMGLGLAVTQGLAKLMGADLTVSSVEGQGSTFAVHVPMRVVRDHRLRHREASPEIRVTDPQSFVPTVRVNPVSAA